MRPAGYLWSGFTGKRKIERKVEGDNKLKSSMPTMGYERGARRYPERWRRSPEEARRNPDVGAT